MMRIITPSRSYDNYIEYNIYIQHTSASATDKSKAFLLSDDCGSFSSVGLVIRDNPMTTFVDSDGSNVHSLEIY